MQHSTIIALDNSPLAPLNQDIFIKKVNRLVRKKKINSLIKYVEKLSDFYNDGELNNLIESLLIECIYNHPRWDGWYLLTKSLPESRQKIINTENIINFIYKIKVYNQHWLINAIHKLGYNVDNEGMCHGFTCLFAIAYLLSHSTEYKKYLLQQGKNKEPYLENITKKMSLIYSYSVEGKTGLKRLLKDVNKAKSIITDPKTKEIILEKYPEILPNDKNAILSKLMENFKNEYGLLELLPLFETITIFDDPGLYSDVFPKDTDLAAQNIKNILPLISPICLDNSNLQITLPESYVDVCDINSLITFLFEIEQIALTIDEPISIVFHFDHHAIHIGYDITEEWTFMDINPAEQKSFSLKNVESVQTILISNLDDDEKIPSKFVISASLLIVDTVSEEKTLYVKNKLKELQRNALKKLTKEDACFKNSYGETILHSLIDHNKPEIIRFLMKNKKIDNYNLTSSKAGFTLLYEACYFNRISCVKLLLQAPGIDINLANKVDDNNANKIDGDTPLICTVEENNIKMLNLLLKEKTIDINQINASTGHTPLILAIKYNHSEIIDRLLKEDSININLANPLKRRTPLMYAIRCQNIHAIKVLIERKDFNFNFNFNYADKKGHNIFYYAMLSQNIDIINALLTSPKSHMGFLLNAIKQGNVDWIKFLLEYTNINVNVQEEINGLTPLMSTILSGDNVKMVKVLVNCTVIDINCCNHYGNTAVHFAVAFDRNEACKILLNCSDIKIDMVNVYNQSPLDIAINTYNYEMINLIIQKHLELLLQNPYYLHKNHLKVTSLLNKIIQINQSESSNEDKCKFIINALESALVVEKNKPIILLFGKSKMQIFEEKIFNSEEGQFIYPKLLIQLLSSFYNKKFPLLNTDNQPLSKNRLICNDIISDTVDSKRSFNPK